MLGKIMASRFAAIKNTKLVQNFAKKAAKNSAKTAVQQAQHAVAKVNPRTAAKAQAVESQIYTNTPGRVQRLADAKAAFTPYQTRVTHESVPTVQKMEEITGVARGGNVKPDEWIDRNAVADALAAFKHPTPNLTPTPAQFTSVKTQQALDELNRVATTDALKAYEETGKLSKELLKKRADCRAAFSGDLNNIESRNLAVLNNRREQAYKKFDEELLKYYTDGKGQTYERFLNIFKILKDV